MNFYQTEEDDSSSLLRPEIGDPTDRGRSIVDQGQVDVRKLDSVLGGSELTAPVLLKLDVQGAEEQVLSGATKLLPSVDYIIAEVGLRKEYFGQPLMLSMLKKLDSARFYPVAVLHVRHSDVGCETPQIDMLFVRGRA